MDISSVIVCARPEGGQEVKQSLEALDGVEVHTVAEDGRMIVTIESPTEQDTVRTYEVISVLPGVLSVAMVYHQVESNPDEEV
jgi:nitrate reductase NapD